MHLNYYRCTVHRTRAPEVCARRTGIRAEPIEAEVFDAVSKVVDDRELLEKEIQHAFAAKRTELTAISHGPKVGEIRKRLEQTERQWIKYQEAYAADALSLADLKARKAELDAERERLGGRVERARNLDERLAALDLQEERMIFFASHGHAIESESRLRHELSMHKTWTPKQRQDAYRQMGLRAEVDENDRVTVSWMLGDGVCTQELVREV